MTFKLLASINDSVNAAANDQAVLDQSIETLFDVTASDSAAAWEAGMVHEASTAGRGRSGEMDWVQSAIANQEEKAQLKSKGLGIKHKPAGMPAKGDPVLLQSGLGRIVDRDEGTKQVIIADKNNVEKVFPMSQLSGPKEIKGKQVWALNRP